MIPFIESDDEEIFGEPPMTRDLNFNEEEKQENRYRISPSKWVFPIKLLFSGWPGRTVQPAEYPLPGKLSRLGVVC